MTEREYKIITEMLEEVMKYLNKELDTYNEDRESPYLSDPQIAMVNLKQTIYLLRIIHEDKES